MMLPNSNKVTATIVIFLAVFTVIMLITAPWMNSDFCRNVLLERKLINSTDNIIVNNYLFGRMIVVSTHATGILSEEISPRTNLNVMGLQKESFIYFSILMNANTKEYALLTDVSDFGVFSLGDKIATKGYIFETFLNNTKVSVMDLHKIELDINQNKQTTFYVTVIGLVKKY